jgi:ankyrin repeat protein
VRPEDEELRKAAEAGNLEQVKEFIHSKKAGVNARGIGEITPLHSAVTNNHLELVTYLVEKGADINARDEYKRTPLHDGHRNINMVTYLVENGASINVHDCWNKTPLHYAISYGSLDIVKYLVEHGANINARNKEGQTPLHCIIYNNPKVRTEIATYLIEKGADVKAHDNRGITILHSAAGEGLGEIVKLCLQKGADINAKAEMNQTPFLWAAGSGNLEMVKYLFSKGADINAKTNDDLTPLLNAIRCNAPLDVIEFLVEKGADVNVGNNQGWTPLHFASLKGNLETVKYLVLHRANINAKALGNKKQLLAAVESGHIANLDKQGIDIINTLSKAGYGVTMLHCAAEQGHVDIVTYFISLNIDASVKTFDGKAPLDLAPENKKDAIKKALGD